MASSAWKIIPQFPSASIRETVHFYETALHFEVGGVSTTAGEEEPGFCSVFLGEKAAANIYFLRTRSGVANPGVALIGLGTKQLDEYYSLLQREDKVTIVEPVEDKEWGFRQFAIRDLDGNRLVFFRFLEGGNPGGTGEEDVSDQTEILSLDNSTRN